MSEPTPSARGTALITGSSVGIGVELARQAAMDGFDLVFLARNREQLETHAKAFADQYHIRTTVLPQDLSQPGAATRVFEELASKNIQLDMLINNAGFGTYGNLADTDVEKTLSLLQVNMVALTHLTRLALPGMISRKRGWIMNVASIAAFLPGPYLATYYASKAYVLSLTEAIASELKGTGVRASALCPGPVRTEFQGRAGLANSKLFQRSSLSSEEVARIGYKGLMRGKTVVVPGFRAWVMAKGARLAPRGMATRVARKLNQNR